MSFNSLDLYTGQSRREVVKVEEIGFILSSKRDKNVKKIHNILNFGQWKAVVPKVEKTWMFADSMPSVTV